MKIMLFLIFAAVSIPVMAEGIELGVNAGAMIPVASFMRDTYSTSPTAGANLIIYMQEYTLEGSISFLLLRNHSDLENFSASMIPFLVGLRSKSGSFFFGGGGALHFVTERYDDPVHGEYDESSSLLGAYFKAGTRIHLMGEDVELSATLHLVDYLWDKAWTGITAGYYF
jgi:hypothetical protein